MSCTVTEAHVDLKHTTEKRTSSLTSESKPFYPLSLRSVFDSAACRVIKAIPPVVPVTPTLSEYKLNTTGKPPNKLDSNVVHLNRLESALHAEELQMECDIRAYDLFYAELSLPTEQETRSVACYRSHPTFLVYLDVPGVGERRPAVNLGDAVQLRSAKHPKKWDIQCYVCEVKEKKILLSFPMDALSLITSLTPTQVMAERFHVRFSYDRQPFRLMYRALEFMKCDPLASRFLFPHASDTKTQSVTDVPLTPFDPLCNDEQLAAVRGIMACPKQPYIIFGPPGTGKTLTLIEAMLQILRSGNTAAIASAGKVSRPHILVCTPSNHSADLIVQRLSAIGKLTPQQLLRLNAYQRYTTVLPGVESYCHLYPILQMYSIPMLTALKQFQVVVCTCAMAGNLVSLGVSRGHFTHVFFDESGQALESEILIPLCLADESTTVVLAGDHCQLGPSIHSALAAKMGLKVSLQERLATLEPYKSHDPRVITQLVRNYRAHPALLAVPSMLFYENSLQAHADRPYVDSLTQWSLLPNKKQFPLVFVGVQGVDHYEPESSSIYNSSEASRVVELVEELLQSQLPLSRTSIGVIAPYRKQVLKLRHLFRARGLGYIKVGSVDDYQGMEEDVIVISTVVSKRRSSSADSTISLGILRNEKRFNVALSRARCLTMVVGNPNILKDEPCWSWLLEYAVKNDAYTGCPLPTSLAGKQPSDRDSTTEDLDISALALELETPTDSTEIELDVGDEWRMMM